MTSKSRILVTCILAIVVFASGCGSNEAPQGPPPPPKVTVVNPVLREVVEWDEYVGRIEATDSVEIRARVDGYLESIHFEEGQNVDKGQLLFVIDPRPFEAAVKSARSELELAKAKLKLAESNLARAKKLFNANAVSQEEYDTRASELDQAKATVESRKAALEEAELDLEFTNVKAPISGRISSELVTEGNLIIGGTGGTLLTTLVSLDPIYCYFEIDERSYLKYVRRFENGLRPGSGESRVDVYMRLSDEEGFPHKGELDFLDNRLDSETGTITARGVFDNGQNTLAPGMFSSVLLKGSHRYEAVQIPEEAVGTDQSQKFVLTVNEENTVSYRPVELGPVIDGLRVVKSGLTTGDRVIISGLQRARPDSKVDSVKEEIEIKTDSVDSSPVAKETGVEE